MNSLVLPKKIMIIRHAEKPGVYGGENYAGINAYGAADDESLVTLGWERAGGVASLFDPTNPLQYTGATLLEVPSVIYAAKPMGHHTEHSQRPYQTILALANKLGVTPNVSFAKNDFAQMVSDVLTSHLASDVVLISWQHQDILPKQAGDDCVVAEIIKQTQSTLNNIPQGPWPGERYDMVLVFEGVANNQYTQFYQVPQMLLAGDSEIPFD